MNRYFKNLMLVAAVAGLYVPSVAMAQKSSGGVTGEARLHPGTWNQRSSRSFTGSRPMYRSTAPEIVRTESAPDSVAQAPSERRSFSYEPSQQNVSGDSCVCGQHAATKEAPSTTQPSTEARRSYSYEPSMNDSPVAPRTYSTPPTQSSRPSPWQRLNGTKAERNNYRN